MLRTTPQQHKLAVHNQHHDKLSGWNSTNTTHVILHSMKFFVTCPRNTVVSNFQAIILASPKPPSC